MSLESAISDLVRAIDTSQPNVAVREIIRQRDEAIATSNRLRDSLKWSEEKRTENWSRLETERRRVRSLRAYIKRLKGSDRVVVNSGTKGKP